MNKRVAIIGSGIAGLTCAWLLREKYDVSLYEANDYVGGHTQTTDVEVNGTSWPVNTGFIVYNDWTYPNFIRLMDLLGVKSEESDMSFSVKCEQSGLEYNGHTLNTLFAQRRNILKPSFWGMIRDILKFNKETRESSLITESISLKRSAVTCSGKATAKLSEQNTSFLWGPQSGQPVKK